MTRLDEEEESSSESSVAAEQGESESANNQHESEHESKSGDQSSVERAALEWREEEEGEEGGKGELVDGLKIQNIQGRAGDTSTAPPVHPDLARASAGDESEEESLPLSTSPRQQEQQECSAE